MKLNYNKLLQCLLSILTGATTSWYPESYERLTEGWEHAMVLRYRLSTSKSLLKAPMVSAPETYKNEV